MNDIFDGFNVRLDCLSTELSEKIISSAVEVVYKKNKIIFHESDEVGGIHIIKNGRVVLKKFDLDGNIYIVDYYSSGNFLGIFSCILGSSQNYNAIATEKTTCLYLEKNKFLHLLREDPDLSFEFLKIASALIRILIESVNFHALKGSADKVAKRILIFSASRGAHERKGLEIRIKISQEELAQSLGLSRHAVYSAIKKLVLLNAIAIRNGYIYIKDNEKLRAFIDE